ncbi:hypothetical protein Ancab_033873 [Ancistrocladus abbreviatus]
MDSDFWTSRLAASKRQFNLQHHHHNLHGASRLDRLNIDEFDVEEELRPEIPCPYCFEDFDIISLCTHLEDEHSSESKATRCRRLRRVAIPSNQTLSLLSRDLREAHLQVLLGGSGFRSSTTSAANAVADPFLSSLVLNFPGTEANEFSKSMVSSTEDSSAKSATSALLWKPSFDSSLSSEERERRIRQATGKAGFVQDLLLCTLLEDY